MAKAETLVRSYAEAGFAKIHLDASMACAGDPDPLPPELIADRAARLARAAEAAGGRPVYVIGTEVPVPGGAHETIEQLEVDPHRGSRRDDRGAPRPPSPRPVSTDGVAARAGGGGAARRRVRQQRRWSTSCPSARAALAAWHRGEPEVSSSRPTRPTTRPRRRWAPWSTQHFAILKVGPGLTFALREALFALAAIEAELAARPTSARSSAQTLEACDAGRLRAIGRATIRAPTPSSASPAPSA